MTSRENALETIMNLGGLSRLDAEIVLDEYLQLRIATYDSVGQVQYSHGHFLDREILLNRAGFDLVDVIGIYQGYQ
jgi:hypothetical protein